MIKDLFGKFKSLFSVKNRALLKELVVTDFKLRYQNSILGYAWSLLKPLMLFIILYVVFVNVFKLGDSIPHFSVYLLLGIVMWNFFAEMTNTSVGAIVSRGDLIRKIYIPRWIIIVSSSFSSLINFLLNLIVVSIFMVIQNVSIQSTAVFLPLVFVMFYVFSLGMSLFLSAAFVKFRDLSHVWEVIMQGLFYATPILYQVSFFNNNFYQRLIFLNPVAFVIQEARFALITDKADRIQTIYNSPWALFIPIIITAIVFIIGLTYFRSQSKYFAENI